VEKDRPIEHYGRAESCKVTKDFIVSLATSKGMIGSKKLLYSFNTPVMHPTVSLLIHPIHLLVLEHERDGAKAE
jgi:hypothetical protein